MTVPPLPLPFTFVDDPAALPVEAGVVEARIAVGEAGHKKALLEALALALRFPGYFGHNWDALEECLRDLSWIEARRVRIVHTVTPPFAAYVAVLRAACEAWGEGDPHQLEVVFPSVERRRVEQLLAD